MLVHKPRRESAPLLLNSVTQPNKQMVEWLRRPGQEIGRAIRAGAIGLGTEQFLKERRVNLGAPVVMGADVVQIGAIRQRVLGNNVDVAAVELFVELGLAIFG